MQITEGEIFALVVAEKALQQYRGTSFEKPLLERHQKNGAGAAGHHFAQPRRHRADHFLPHARRADFESGNFRRAGQGRRAAAANGTALSQTRPDGGEARVVDAVSFGEHQWRMVSLRLRPRAQRPPHFCAGAHPIRQADGQNFRAHAKIFAGEKIARQLWRPFRRRRIRSCHPLQRRAPPITSAKRNGTSRRTCAT